MGQTRPICTVAICLLAGLFGLWLTGMLISKGALPSASRNENNPAISHQPKSSLRRLDARLLEKQLLMMGFDVQVTYIEEDDSRMIIYGKSVNRPFAYNLMVSRDLKKLLHDGKFTEVTFMDSMSSPNFVQAFRIGKP